MTHQIGDVLKLKSGEFGKVVAVADSKDKNPFMSRWDYIIQMNDGESRKIQVSDIDEVHNDTKNNS